MNRKLLYNPNTGEVYREREIISYLQTILPNKISNKDITKNISNILIPTYLTHEEFSQIPLKEIDKIGAEIISTDDGEYYIKIKRPTSLSLLQEGVVYFILALFLFYLWYIGFFKEKILSQFTRFGSFNFKNS